MARSALAAAAAAAALATAASGGESPAHLIVLLDDGPVTQLFAVNTSDGTQIGRYWLLPGYDAVPAHPSCSAPTRSALAKHGRSPQSAWHKHAAAPSPPSSMYWAVLQSKATGGLVLVGVDLSVPPPPGGAGAPLAVEVPLASPYVWGLFCDEEHGVIGSASDTEAEPASEAATTTAATTTATASATANAGGVHVIACCSDAASTWCGMVNLTSGEVPRSAVADTSPYAFAVAHAYDADAGEVWAAFRAKSANTNYLVRLNPHTGESPPAAEIAGGWFVADMQHDRAMRRMHALASVQNATGGPLLGSGSGSSGSVAAAGGGKQAKARSKLSGTYGDLGADGRFAPGPEGGGVPSKWELDAFSSAADERAGLLYAFGARSYTTPPGPRDGWNVVVTLDLATGVLLRTSDGLTGSHSVVAGAWGIEAVAGARPQ